MTERHYCKVPFDDPEYVIYGPNGEIFEFNGNKGYCEIKQMYYADYLQTF